MSSEQKPLPWFRFYAKFITDPEIEELSFEDQRHFVFVLCLKCNGLLDKDFGGDTEKRERAIARRLGLQGEAFTWAKERLVTAGLIDEQWQPLKWDELQFRSDHDPTSAERQRRYRAKRNSNALRHGDVTPPEQRQNRDRTEQRDAPRKRGSRLPEDWRAGEELLDWARQQRPDLDVTVEEEKFRDYWLAKTGQNATKRDWSRTFKNWIRNARAPYRSAGGGTGDENYI